MKIALLSAIGGFIGGLIRSKHPLYIPKIRR
jgi:hypothetical protein